MNKTYFLKPTMTLNTVTTLLDPHKPGVTPGSPQDRAIAQMVTTIAPSPPAAPNVLSIAASSVAKPLPPCQPLPTPVLYPDKPSLKLGLDVHLEFIMAVVQLDHASPQAPRKLTPRTTRSPSPKMGGRGFSSLRRR